MRSALSASRWRRRATALLWAAGAVALLAGVPVRSQEEDVSPCTTEQYVLPPTAAARQALRNGLDQDVRTAAMAGASDIVIDLLCRGAAAGFGGAELRLALLVAGGKYGLESDPVIVRRWLERALRHGEQNAGEMLGSMYLAGDGGPVRAAEGIVLLRDAANTGSTSAMVHIAAELATGRHLRVDLDKARIWAERARAAGDPRGAKLVELIDRYRNQDHAPAP